MFPVFCPFLIAGEERDYRDERNCGLRIRHHAIKIVIDLPSYRARAYHLPIDG